MKNFATITAAAFAFMIAMTSCTVEEQILPTGASEVPTEDWQQATIEYTDQEATPEEGFQQKEPEEIPYNEVQYVDQQTTVDQKVQEKARPANGFQKGNDRDQLDSPASENMDKSKNQIVIINAPKVNKTSHQ
ncbi:MAG: hypothetical protein AAFY71_24270 [Bacteroidota bacterium]